MREYYQNLLQQQEIAKQMAAEKQRLERSMAQEPKSKNNRWIVPEMLGVNIWIKW